jgi:hypothetical protein
MPLATTSYCKSVEAIGSAIEEERSMPIRHSFSLSLALAGAIACGGLLDCASAAEAGVPHADTRDLKPTPIRPDSVQARRPEVTLRPSAGVVAVGAPVTFEVSSSANGFGHIYVLSASGRVQVWLENAPIAAGQRLLFPTGELGIEAAAPTGREDLMLIVTRDRINGFFGYEGTNAPRLVDYSQAAFKKKLTEKFAEMPHAQWGYARTSVEVVERLASSSGWGVGAGSGSGGSAPTNLWAGQWED